VQQQFLIINVRSIDVNFGSPLIANNNISREVITHRGTAVDYPTITGNNITNAVNNYQTSVGNQQSGILCIGYANISNNVISGFSEGIKLITDANGWAGQPLILRNLIINNTIGIDINAVGDEAGGVNIEILNNTLTNNTYGIYLYDDDYQSSYFILYNNFHNNYPWNIYLIKTRSTATFNVTYNWWGQTAVAFVNQTINYVGVSVPASSFTLLPLLTEPNPKATPDLNMPLPTSTSTPSAPTETPTSSISQSLSPTVPTLSTAEPSIPEFPTGLSLLLIALILAIALMVIKRNG
jgi:hypothetical protein